MKIGREDGGKEGIEMEKKDYCGKIKNTGAQFVQAPNQQPKTKDQTKITTGKDLRTRAGSK